MIFIYTIFHIVVDISCMAVSGSLTIVVPALTPNAFYFIFTLGYCGLNCLQVYQFLGYFA